MRARDERRESVQELFRVQHFFFFAVRLAPFQITYGRHFFGLATPLSYERCSLMLGLPIVLLGLDMLLTYSSDHLERNSLA